MGLRPSKVPPGMSLQNMNRLLSQQRKQFLKMIYKMSDQFTEMINRLVEAKKKDQEKAQTPEQYHAIQVKYENKFVESLRTLKFQQVIHPKVGRHYCFIGPTSCGKSTLWNHLFGLNLPIGLGSCTKQANQIYKQGNITYWDAPGINKDFGFYQPHHFGFFNDLDKIFVLFETEIDSYALILKVFNVMKKEVVIVRTKCDNWNQKHQKTVQQQFQNGLQQARKYYPACKRVIGMPNQNYELSFY